MMQNDGMSSVFKKINDLFRCELMIYNVLNRLMGYGGIRDNSAWLYKISPRFFTANY